MSNGEGQERAADAATATARLAASAILVILRVASSPDILLAIVIFAAANPGLYPRGVLALLPPGRRARSRLRCRRATPLPSAAPELNPQENVWEWLRKNKLALRVFDSYDDIVEACCQAWNDFIADPATVASVTRRDWAKAVKT